MKITSSNNGDEDGDTSDRGHDDHLHLGTFE